MHLRVCVALESRCKAVICFLLELIGCVASKVAINFIYFVAKVRRCLISKKHASGFLRY